MNRPRKFDIVYNSSNETLFEIKNNTMQTDKHQSSETSLKAFKEINKNGSRATQKDRIYAHLLNCYATTTRKKVAAALHLPLSNVCGRINDLMNEGFILVVDSSGKEELLIAVVEPIETVKRFKYTDEFVISFVKLFANLNEKYLDKRLQEVKRNYK